MHKNWSAFFLAVFIAVGCFAAENIPEPGGRVNDFAGVISPEYKEKINSLITGLEQKTSSEIAVVTIDSIAPYDETEYARLLFDKWKPGKKGKDNGVLILLAVKERRWRIETGYGVEGVLPDSLCGRIGRDYMVPYFKRSDYGGGLYQGVSFVIKTLNGEALPVPEEAEADKDNFLTFIFLAALALFIGNFLFLLIIGATVFFLIPFPINLIVFIILMFMGILRASFAWPALRGGSGYHGGSFGGGFSGGGFGGFGGGGGGGGGAGGGF